MSNINIECNQQLCFDFRQVEDCSIELRKTINNNVQYADIKDKISQNEALKQEMGDRGTIVQVRTLTKACWFYFQTTVKPAYVVTSIKQSPVLKGNLSRHRTFHMNLTSFKRSPVLKVHYFISPKVTS